MEIMTEETFGPVVGIMKVENDEEALALMNDSVYGLVGCEYFFREHASYDVCRPLLCGPTPVTRNLLLSSTSSQKSWSAALSTSTSLTRLTPHCPGAAGRTLVVAFLSLPSSTML